MNFIKKTIKKNQQSLFKTLSLKIDKSKTKKTTKLSVPYSIKDILELNNNFTQIKNNITYPSMKYFLKASYSELLEFESPIDIVLMVWWTPIGTKIIYFLSFLIGSFIILGLGSYIYKLIKLKKQEIYQFKILSSELKLLEQNRLDDQKLIEEYSLIIKKLNKDNDDKITKFSNQILTKIKKEQQLYILQIITTITLSCLTFGLFSNLSHQQLAVLIINYLKDKIRPQEKVLKYIDYILREIIINIDKQILGKLKDVNQITNLWDSRNQDINLQSSIDNEIEHIVKQDISIKKNREKIKEYLTKIEDLDVRQKRYLEIKKLLKDSKKMSGGYFGFSNCFFTGYQGIFDSESLKTSNIKMKNSELNPIRTLWQDQDIFFVNGKKNINISDTFYHQELQVNKNSLYLVQRIKNVKKITIMNNEYQSLTNYNFDQNNNCLYKYSDKNKKRPVIEIIMNINDEQLLIPLKITNSGLFLNGLSQKISNKDNKSKLQPDNNEIQYPNPDFINQLPSMYQQITTLVPIKRIEEISPYNTKMIKNQIIKKINS